MSHAACYSVITFVSSSTCGEYPAYVFYSMNNILVISFPRFYTDYNMRCVPETMLLDILIHTFVDLGAHVGFAGITKRKQLESGP